MDMILCTNTLGYIGDTDGTLMYRFEQDMENFKKRTENKTLVCGRNTYYELSPSVFKRCPVIVVSNSLYHEPPNSNVLIVPTLNSIFRYVHRDDIAIIGGVGLYEEALKEDLVDVLYWTVVLDDRIGRRKVDTRLLNTFYTRNQPMLSEEHLWTCSKTKKEYTIYELMVIRYGSKY